MMLLLNHCYCFHLKVSEVDGWRASTVDGKRSAQWEHTILVTKSGYEILTLRKEEEAEGVERVGPGGLGA